MEPRHNELMLASPFEEFPSSGQNTPLVAHHSADGTLIPIVGWFGRESSSSQGVGSITDEKSVS